MPQIIDGLPDSQHVLKISTDAGLTFTKVALVTNIDMPERKKVIDDITPTDARNTWSAVVDFTEDSDVSFELVYKPTDAEHIAIKNAYNTNAVIQCEIHFADATVKGYKFDGMISEFTLVPDMKKKLRAKGTIVIGSDVTEIVSSIGP